MRQRGDAVDAAVQRADEAAERVVAARLQGGLLAATMDGRAYLGVVRILKLSHFALE